MYYYNIVHWYQRLQSSYGWSLLGLEKSIIAHGLVGLYRKAEVTRRWLVQKKEAAGLQASGLFAQTCARSLAPAPPNPARGLHTFNFPDFHRQILLFPNPASETSTGF
jgi:hypothetical protein